MFELATADGLTVSAYRAEPAGAPRGALIVVQEDADLTPHTRKMADLFAAKGYLTIATSLFGGGDPADGAPAPARTADVVKQLGAECAYAALVAAIETAAPAGKVAVLGYGWGGYLAYLAANAVPGIACVVCYYGDGIVDEFGAKRRVPTLVHFAGNDAAVPSEKIIQFRASRPDVSAFSYPGVGHGFDGDDDGHFDAAAAETARERSLFWISQFVEGQPPVTLKNAGAYAQAKVEKKKKKAAGDDLGPPAD
jgi:carboxymethylenebutenolidase